MIQKYICHVTSDDVFHCKNSLAQNALKARVIVNGLGSYHRTINEIYIWSVKSQVILFESYDCWHGCYKKSSKGCGWFPWLQFSNKTPKQFLSVRVIIE